MSEESAAWAPGTGATVSGHALAAQIAVVIPYYQKEPGLLRACVESVLQQQGVPPCRVVVVDDGSPRPAALDLVDLIERHPQIQVVQQANAGPGAARNRGLDAVPEATPFVAFLDSDDRWEPDYAATALRAFAAGADLYFANSVRYGNAKSRFEWDHASGLALDAAAHVRVDAGAGAEGTGGLYLFEGDFFDFALRRSGIISTSTLAFRRACAPRLRFETRLFNGQDRFFKLQMARAASRCAFCTRIGATEGRGINIFDSAQWGSSKSLVLLVNYLRLARLILQELPLSGPQRAYVQSQLAALRGDVARTVVHQLRSGVRLRMALLWQCFRVDPGTALMFLPHVVSAAWRRVKG